MKLNNHHNDILRSIGNINLMIDIIENKGQICAYLYTGQIPSQTTFLTESHCQQQAGYVIYPKDSMIQKHYHRHIERNLYTTTEVLLVLKGKCIVDFYDDTQALVISRELHSGNVLIIIAGGHGFRVVEDLILFEVKQGPYSGLNEKVKF